VIRALAIAALMSLVGCESARDPAPKALVWETDEAAALARARAEDKGVMIDFRSEWCAPCKELDARTFADPAVIAHIAPRYVPLKIDLTEDTAEDQAIMQRYRVELLPTVLFVDADGTERGRIGEFLAPRPFIAAATSTSIESRTEGRAAPLPAR
jgi:thiol:disulfide interchange protein DsbD